MYEFQIFTSNCPYISEIFPFSDYWPERLLTRKSAGIFWSVIFEHMDEFQVFTSNCPHISKIFPFSDYWPENSRNIVDLLRLLTYISHFTIGFSLKLAFFLYIFVGDFFLANIYLFKVNNGNIRAMCEITSKLTMKTPCSGVSIVDFE